MLLPRRFYTTKTQRDMRGSELLLRKMDQALKLSGLLELLGQSFNDSLDLRKQRLSFHRHSLNGDIADTPFPLAVQSAKKLQILGYVGLVEHIRFLTETRHDRTAGLKWVRTYRHTSVETGSASMICPRISPGPNGPKGVREIGARTRNRFPPSGSTSGASQLHSKSSPSLSVISSSSKSDSLKNNVFMVSAFNSGHQIMKLRAAK